MAVEPTTFEPMSHISNGKKGLSKKQGTHSTVRITGSGLSDNLDVTVLYPASGTATLQWTGKTKDTNPGGTECTVRLKEDLPDGGKPAAVPPIGEDPTAVSVTVGNTPMTTNPTVNIGSLPVCTTGVYVVSCCGTGGGTKTVLTVVNGTVALVSSPNPVPNWTFNLLSDNAGNCYTIKQGGSQYLQWSADGTVTVVNAPNPPQTTWQLTAAIGGTALIKATCSPQQYLNGNTSTGGVNVQPAEDQNGGTNWMLQTVEPL